MHSLRLCRPRVDRLRLISTPRRARHTRCENLLTVTGRTGEVTAFKSNARAVPPGSFAYLPRGLAFLDGTSPLSFHRMLPIEVSPGAEGALAAAEAKEHLWGCSTDATEVRVLPGWPRAKGRSSVKFEFVTDETPPLRWLEAIAAQEPGLRFGLKYALPHVPAAFEVEYQRGKRILKTQVSYAAWAWKHKAEQGAVFTQLKALLRLPDGRLPRKRRVTAANIEERLRAQGAYLPALQLLGDSVRGGSWAGLAHTHAKLFHELVLPEFATWLRSPDGARLAI